MIKPPPEALLNAAEEKQRAAADPAVSAWVRANAGTGKTYVLVQRILRLLLSGATPRSVLCLTFTKNAAAEMEARVLARLGEWATADRETLTANLTKLLDRAPDDAELALAPCLFASVIDAPGGLAILTIHGFCERILRRYSFEANVPPGFTVLTEEEARDALGVAQAQVFASAGDGPLREALETVVAYAAEAEFSRVLEAMLARRCDIARLLQVADRSDPFGGIERSLRRLFGTGNDATSKSLLARSVALLSERTLKELISVLLDGTATDHKAAHRFQAVSAANTAEDKHAALKAAFATDKGEPRQSLMTATLRQRATALHERLVETQAAFLALDEQVCGLKVVEATMALVRLAAAIFERYEAEKRARAALDFDDLVARTLSLFSREEASDWVLYQLDARIDHILVDEAQDTSPQQWDIIEKLTSDFFSGDSARSTVPTLFAVGDEKQSIYGFQGAAPDLLAHHGAAYEKKVREAGLPWQSLDLNLSFRTLASVLAAVDGVTGALPGMKDGSLVPHVAFRQEGAGLVELWEPEKGEKEDKGTVWETDAAVPAAPKPAEALAARISAQIRHWLDSGAMLASGERQIEPGDILILLKKRAPMAGLLQAALKRAGIPVCGADRVALLDELAVMDLMSLASVILQPEDDLAFAEVLKSPLFGFSDGDLFDLSFGREQSLWRALEEAASNDGNPIYAGAAAKLAEWRDLALHATPFDFFSHILEAEGGKAAFAARLGAECFDALDELLNLAEAFGARGLLSLAEFLVSLRRGVSEVKRETGHAAQEVRIMTVHGAKGLEANVVILADACGNRGAKPAPVYFVAPAKGAARLPVWAIKGASRLPAIAGAKNRLKDEEQRELGRLLYVAMTRARDHLHITGFHKGNLPAACWYETVKSALAGTMETGEGFQGRPFWRHGSPQQARPSSLSSLKKANNKAMPPWFGAPVRGEQALSILVPSRMSRDEPIRPFEKLEHSDRNRARTMGILIHRLLEVLPQLPAAERAKAASAIASAFAAELSARQRESAIESAFTALSSEVFAVRRQLSLAETGIAATLRDHRGKRCGIITGQADRILFDGAEIHILDYKSGGSSADSALSPQHGAQLAGYRHALRRLYQDTATIHAAVFNTLSMRLHHAEGSELDDFLEQFSSTIGE